MVDIPLKYIWKMVVYLWKLMNRIYTMLHYTCLTCVPTLPILAYIISLQTEILKHMNYG